LVEKEMETWFKMALVKIITEMVACKQKKNGMLNASVVAQVPQSVPQL